MEKKKEIYLGRHAMILKQYMKEEDPGLYKEMKKAGTLEPLLEQRENNYLDGLTRLEKEGLNRAEANELLWPDLMMLPAKD